MTVSEILELAKGYGANALVLAVILSALVEIAPIKLNPWSRIAKWIGGAVNKDVLSEIKALRRLEDETQSKLDAHIKVDDERDADMHRYRILRFNTEMLRNMRHTEEEFNEVFYSINAYNRFCRDHPGYENNRAVRAIANINKVYDKCVEEHSFL